MRDLQKRLNVTTSVFGRLESIKMLGISTWAGDTLRTLRDKEVDSSLIFRTLLLWSVVICRCCWKVSPLLRSEALMTFSGGHIDARPSSNVRRLQSGRVCTE